MVQTGTYKHAEEKTFEQTRETQFDEKVQKASGNAANQEETASTLKPTAGNGILATLLLAVFWIGFDHALEYAVTNTFTNTIESNFKSEIGIEVELT